MTTSWISIYKNVLDDLENKSEDPIFNMVQEHLYKTAIGDLGLEKGDKLLDAGCGVGALIEHLPVGIHYTGIDISEPNLELARKRHPDKEFHSSDIRQMVFDDEMFDKCVCTEVIEHLEEKDWIEALMEMKRVIRKGGIVVVTVPNLNYLWCLVPWSLWPLKRRLGFKEYFYGFRKGYVNEGYSTTSEIELPHYRFKATFLKRLFAVAGLEVLEYHSTFNYNNRVIHGILPKQQQMIARWSMKFRRGGAQLVFQLRR